MFGWFKKKTPHLKRGADEVYGSRAVADRALVAAAEAGSVVASFFPQSLERIGVQLEQAGHVTHTLRKGWQVSAPGAVLLLDLRGLTMDTGFSTWRLRQATAPHFLFVEHFPTNVEEARLLSFFAEFTECEPSELRFFVGLDEPLMAAFGGERLVELMKKLGMGADEKVSHSMVDKAIENAQAKLSDRVPNPSPAESAREWFATNYPA